jgi:hypothetical protein
LTVEIEKSAGNFEHGYREGLKNWQDGQGGSSDFLAGARGIVVDKTRSEDEKYEKKPT